MSKEIKNLFIIGFSGCGKSTQAKLIAEKYNLTHLSMGQLLRDEIASQTDLGKEAQSYVDQGKWAPNELVFRILTANLAKINNQNFIVDGFPRHVDQMKDMDTYLQEKDRIADLIIHLDVTAQEIADRRNKVAQVGGVFQTGRNDETPEAITARQKSYEESIEPIFEYLSQDSRLFRIDGNRPVEPIFADIIIAIDKLS
jgi:adenylate kinase